MEKINKRLLSWASVLEDNTREQAMRTASMPFIFPHPALMPDAHLGKAPRSARSFRHSVP
jgi:tRNA-splicing ligase RtcB (3'-phosphate/5'-hydroxy nucleic acid ligase)